MNDGSGVTPVPFLQNGVIRLARRCKDAELLEIVYRLLLEN